MLLLFVVVCFQSNCYCLIVSYHSYRTGKTETLIAPGLGPQFVAQLLHVQDTGHWYPW